MDTVDRKSVSLLGSRVEDALRFAIEGPIDVPKIKQECGLNLQLCSQQLRGVRHSSRLAEDVLGYNPVYTLQQSMPAFSFYYNELRGFNTPLGDLLNVGNS